MQVLPISLPQTQMVFTATSLVFGFGFLVSSLVLLAGSGLSRDTKRLAQAAMRPTAKNLGPVEARAMLEGATALIESLTMITTTRNGIGMFMAAAGVSFLLSALWIAGQIDWTSMELIP